MAAAISVAVAEAISPALVSGMGPVAVGTTVTASVTTVIDRPIAATITVTPVLYLQQTRYELFNHYGALNVTTVCDWMEYSGPLLVPLP